MLVPNNITEFASQGEKLLYNKFKSEFTNKKIFILHSVFIHHHYKNISGEIDFLVLIPNEGFFAIEVKHGGVSRHNGNWQYTDRNGNVSKTDKSPFAQVNASMNSLRNFILKKLENDPIYYNKFRKFIWGTSTAFTSLNEMPDIGQEGFHWQVFLSQNLYKSLDLFLENLSKNWHREYSSKPFYDFNNARPTLHDCEKILKLIRGDFDIDYTPLNRMLDNELQIKQFTEEQFVSLNIVEINPRSLVIGAAGTGKSILAIEQIRRCIEKQIKFAFFCFNKNFAEYIESLFSGLQSHNFIITSFHSYLFQCINNNEDLNSYDKNSNTFYEEILPTAFLIENELNEKDKFDLIIIDEAQDLIKPNYLDVFDSILKGGLKNGNFSFYGDFSNQAIFNNTKHSLIEVINSRTYFTKVPELTINCRNTKRISQQNTLITQVAKPSNFETQLEGDPVHIQFIASNEINLIIESELNKLENNKVPFSKISILSFKEISKSSLNISDYIKKMQKKGLTFTTVHSYKGLENTYVFLIDFPDFTDTNITNLLYVGISRARLKLYLYIEEQNKNSFNKLIQNNISNLK